MISEEVLRSYLTDFKYKLPEFSFDNLNSIEKESIFKAAINFGFDVKEDQVFFNIKQDINKDEKYQGALIIKGDYSIPDKGIIKTDEGKLGINLLIFHYTLENYRLKKISHHLIEKKIVSLYPGCDEDWLYTSLSEQMETNFYELIKKVNRNLPLFEVNFNSNGSFQIESQGNV